MHGIPLLIQLAFSFVLNFLCQNLPAEDWRGGGKSVVMSSENDKKGCLGVFRTLDMDPRLNPSNKASYLIF